MLSLVLSLVTCFAAGEPSGVPAHGAPHPVARPVTFEDVLRQVAGVPRLEGARAAVQAKKSADAHISALTLNPQISAQPGWRLLPIGGREAEAIVEIVQPWNLSGHGDSRRRTVGIEEAALEAGVRALSLERRLVGARAWFELWASERVMAELETAERVAEELERLVDRSASLGGATRADLAEAKAFHAEARLALLAAEGEVFDRGLVLARELGRSEPGPLHAQGALPAAPLPARASLDRLIGALERLPEPRLRALNARAERAREAEERAARGSVLGLGVTAQRDAPGGLVLSAIARLSLPVFDRGERERGVMAAAAALREGDARAVVLETRAELVGGLHESEHTAAIAQALREDLVPAAREAAALRRRIYEQGNATLFEVLFAERTALAAASRLVRADAAHAWADVKLWLYVAALELEPPAEPVAGGRR